MKRMILAALAATACATGLLAAAPAQATVQPAATVKVATTSNPVAIFLTPHQDDETLTMGAAIREHVAAGRDVKVIILTDGGGSAVCQDPPYNGNRAQCVAERDKEFINAVTEMGAQPIIPVITAPGNSTPRALDGQLTGTFTANVIRQMAGVYGTDASFKTMSEYDSIHPDHAAAGRGLYAAYLWGYIGTGPSTGDARFYVRREDQASHGGSCTSEVNNNAALTLYHPIGWLSVKDEFDWAFNTAAYPDKGSFSKVFTPSQRSLAGPGNDSLGHPETCYWPQYTPISGKMSTGTR